MHTAAVLHKLLVQSVPSIHAVRLAAVMASVDALTRGAKSTVTSLGRNLVSDAFVKHKIKRVDRLLSNRFFYQEHWAIHAALTRQLTAHLPEPVILIDWSPLCADQSWQLLRAALPVGGRSLTLYEEVHPRSKLGNRVIQHRFVDQLATMLPVACRPIIVADSGFRTPFYRYLERHLKWHWVGRIRGRDFLCWVCAAGQWFSAKALYAQATTTALCLGQVQWVKTNPLHAVVVLIRQGQKKRQALTLAGNKRQSKHSKSHAARENEPWLLVASLSLQTHSANQLVKLYRTRMQIEEGFRDCKAVHHGLGLSQHRTMVKERRTLLCLLTTLANFVLWCIGVAAKDTPLARQVRVNSSSKRKAYSDIFLARLLIAQKHFRLPHKAIQNSMNTIQPYLESILWG